MARWVFGLFLCGCKKLINGTYIGYGATPLPSIYDALVYEKNATLAQEEVHRVRHLLEDLADTIRP